MGFYGNITNTSNTTFSFDRIYPNRLAMDANANNDGIFVGRYVLVEYQEKAAYPVAYHATLLNGSNTQYYFYSSTNKEEISKIKYLGLAPNEPEHLPSVDDVNAIYQDGFYKGEILQYYIYSSVKKDWIFSEDFYKCVGGIDGYAIFEKIETPEMKSDYIQNFEIDENHYGQNSKGFKGYDSTVWVKSSVEQSGKLITKYVSIADLNSVVPTFDIAADAPTMTPITPHFDADSTNVYYKLHAQPQWGFRIAKADADKSDENTQWIREFYNPNNNTSTKKYASGVTDGIPDWGDDSTATLPAAIYFNEDGFKKQLINTDERQGKIKKHSTTVTENTIKVEPTGKSGIEYNTHNGLNGPSTSVQVDTQELTINLPAIGNMVSDAWDIIHGPNRDNSTVDSLQGRLDFFKNEIAHNEIPIQSSESEGYLVGSVINGAISYENSIDNSNSDKSVYNDNILEVEINSKKQHEHDDAWIATNIDTNQGKDGDKDYHRKAISIHHTFHKRDDSVVNELNINNYDGKSGGSAVDPDTQFQKIINKDTIQLYVPKVDKAGHVVGTDIDKIILPYGYKHFTTNGLVDETQSDLDNSIGRKTTASNTQDTLAIDTKNKWLQVEITDNKIEFAHEIHDIEQSNKTTTDLNDGTNTITIQDTTYDNAGHIIANQNHTYILPYGFKYIKIANDGNAVIAAPPSTVGTQVADSTQDTLKLTTSNKWILLDGNTEDTIKFGHLLSPLSKGEHASSDTILGGFGESFKILKYETDEAGHVVGSGEDTITLPIGSYAAANSATTHTDIITSLGFTPRTGAITSTKANTDTLILYNYSANDGNLDIKATDTINTGLEKIQNHINGLDMSSTSTTDFITEITQTDGKVAVKRAKAGTLVLGTQSTDKTVSADDSLNSAINKLEARIKTEEENRKAAINTLYGDNAENIADTFDTIKEIADFLEQDDNGTQSGIEKIISNISTNADAIKTEKLRATQAETALSTDITEEETRAKAAENALTTNLNNEISRAKGAENTLTTNLNNEVTRATNAENTLNTRITNLVGNTAVSTQIDNKISAFDSTLGTAAKVDIEAYEARIATLEATVLSLEQRLTALETANTSPPATE